MRNIAFIGLGIMGAPMAENLLRDSRFQLQVYDIDAAKARCFADKGARVCTTIAEVMHNVDVVMTSLPGPTQIVEVAFSAQGLLAHARQNTTWIDLSTNNIATCQRIVAQAEKQGIGFVDAPVSGGDEGARAGTLTILVGASRKLYEQCLPIFQAMGEKIDLLGDNGAGYAAKIAQVVLCYLHSLALSEALMLGVKGGVEASKMLSIIQNSTAKSYVANRYGPSILNGDYDPSFALGLANKDMRLALEMASSLGVEIPMCELTAATYAEAVAKYGADANHLKAVRLLEEHNQTYLRSSASPQ